MVSIVALMYPSTAPHDLKPVFLDATITTPSIHRINVPPMGKSICCPCAIAKGAFRIKKRLMPNLGTRATDGECTDLIILETLPSSTSYFIKFASLAWIDDFT